MSDRSPHPTSKKRSHPDNDDPPERSKTPEGTALPPEQQRSNKETPAKPRSAHSSSFWDGGLGERRVSLLEDLGYVIPEVQTDTFLNIFFPPLKGGLNTGLIEESLRNDGIISSNGRWAAFPKDPRSLHKGENATFQPLENIFNEVVGRAIRLTSNLTQSFALRLLPNTAPTSERESTTRPDGCFILKEEEGPNNTGYKWYDIALTCEFKKYDDAAQQDDNVTKIVYSMQHTMTLDPCKRFTFGITMENTNARLWFCSRAIMAVSRPFDFIKESNLLIHVFLSLAFATKVELGWDPTMRVVNPNAKDRVYDIEVNGKSYRVVKVLSDFGADAIISRATRVFHVKHLESGQFYVLKDVWVEDDRDLEHDIRDRILDDVKNVFDPDIMKKVASHLLTPVNYWLVNVNGQEDHTRTVMMRGHDVSFANSFRLKAQDFGNKDSTKAVAPMKSSDRELRKELNAHLGSRAVTTQPKKPIRHRRHYRIVFHETAQPIWTLTNLSEVFLVLKDSATALQYIHGAGWIHRDISAGNIYFFREQKGRGLIGDLEYAKKVEIDGSHQMRTGTPDFMAIEVLMDGYQFLPKKHSQSEITKRLKSGVVDRRQRAPFVQNEAHDLESLWWIANYTLFFNRDISAEATAAQDEARLKYMQDIFPSSAVGMARINFLRDDTHYDAATSWFSSSFLQLRETLDHMRDALITTYYELEAALPNVVKGVFDGLHYNSILAFDICMDKASNITISSYKAKGSQSQKGMSGEPDPSPLDSIADKAPVESSEIELLGAPRKPERKLGLRRP